RRFRAANALTLLARQDGLGVLSHLLGRLQVLLVEPSIIVLAVIRRVLAADDRPVVINAATIVMLQMLANRMDQQVPRFAVLEERGRFVQQIPANEVPVAQLGGFFDRQRKIAATLGSTVLT